MHPSVCCEKLLPLENMQNKLVHMFLQNTILHFFCLPYKRLLAWFVIEKAALSYPKLKKKNCHFAFSHYSFLSYSIFQNQWTPSCLVLHRFLYSCLVLSRLALKRFLELIVARWICENGPFLTPYRCHQNLGYLKKNWMPVVNIHWCPWTLKGLNI